MIIRKPYAFLIKNFKKLHILLLVLSIYVAYKLFDINNFISDFMKNNTYELLTNPINKHITTGLRLSVLIIAVLSFAFLILVLHKKKPWKIYLIPAIDYALLYFILGAIKSFFINYSIDTSGADVRMYKDILLILMIGQFVGIIIYFVRVTGLDINKFDFNPQKEFLELSEEDREEIEIGVSIDKNSFIRLYKRVKRNLNYIYIEHPIMSKVFIVFIILFLIQNFYTYIFVINKVYKEGDLYSVDGYTFRINGSYYTDKDASGNIISNKSGFIILKITVQNNNSTKPIKIDKFHIKSSGHDFLPTQKMYGDEFKDLGEIYDGIQVLNYDTKKDYIVVYKVNKKNILTNYDLFYQETGGQFRKIKLNIKNISKMKRAKELKVGDSIKLDTYNFHEEFEIESVSIKNESEYTIKECDNHNKCMYKEKTVKAKKNKQILILAYLSNEIHGKNMIDFLSNYGKLKYIDSKGKDVELDLDDAVDKNYTDRILYLNIPQDAIKANFQLKIVIRNDIYIYNLT